MPGAPNIRSDLKHEGVLATVSLAGIRPLVNASVAVGASAEGTYTIANISTKRVVLYHKAADDLDIRVDLNATAVATDFPVASGVYFVMEVEKDDVVHLFNNNASSVTVYLMEIR